MVLCFFFRRIIMRFFSVHIYLRICDWLLNLLWIDPWFTINPTFLVSPISNRNQFRHAKETHFAPSSFTSTTALMTPPPKKKDTTHNINNFPFFCLFFLCAFLLFGSHDFLKTPPPKRTKEHLTTPWPIFFPQISIYTYKISKRVEHLYILRIFLLKQTVEMAKAHNTGLKPCDFWGRGEGFWWGHIPASRQPHLEIEFQRRQGIASCGMWCTTPFHASVLNAVQNAENRRIIYVWKTYIHMRYCMYLVYIDLLF